MYMYGWLSDKSNDDLLTRLEKEVDGCEVKAKLWETIQKVENLIINREALQGHR